MELRNIVNLITKEINFIQQFKNINLRFKHKIVNFIKLIFADHFCNIN